MQQGGSVDRVTKLTTGKRTNTLLIVEHDLQSRFALSHSTNPSNRTDPKEMAKMKTKCRNILTLFRILLIIGTCGGNTLQDQELHQNDASLLVANHRILPKATEDEGNGKGSSANTTSKTSFEVDAKSKKHYGGVYFTNTSPTVKENALQRRRLKSKHFSSKKQSKNSSRDKKSGKKSSKKHSKTSSRDQPTKRFKKKASSSM
jgi:hypothetical protein